MATTVTTNTTTTTTVDRKRDLISVESLVYMRPLRILFECTDMKPRSRLYASFDGVAVNEFCTPLGGPDANIQGGRIIVDENGTFAGYFDVPGMTFNTGARTFKLTENPDPTAPDLPGSTYGYATATFTSAGRKETYQETVTTTNNIRIETITRTVLPPPAPPVPDWSWMGGDGGDGGGGDPLAQSFFTYGVSGGCFITSIDLFVNTKDNELPLIVELREMINGYPGPTLIHPDARVSKRPQDINVSSDASVATNFAFDSPIYLKEDKDYCFVILTNCGSYHVFTSNIGEKSFENGRTVFEQPYLGSMFKSQNNMTWTAEQTEDIKFTLYKAQFSTNVAANVKFAASSPPVAIPCEQLSTVAGSNVIRATLNFDHNLEIGNKIQLAADTRGTYNGISAANLTGTFDVTRIVSRRIVEFLVVPNATITGPIYSGGFITSLFVNSQGSGYDPLNPPTVIIAPPPSGVTAIATPVIENGKIVRFNMVNPGSGYVTPPVVSIGGSVGTGAAATAVMNLKFSIVTNRSYQTVNPSLGTISYRDTSVRSTYTSTKGNYEGGNIATYAQGDTIEFDVNKKNWIPQNAILASRANEQFMMAGRRSGQIEMQLSTTNPNVSPIVSVAAGYGIFAGNLINNQDGEDIESNDSSGEVVDITVTDGGSGYDAPPLVEIYNEYGEDGSGATAIAEVTAGSVTSVSITNGGTGYFRAPQVRFVGTNTSPAVATATISDFNSELSPTHGTARSRYITQINTLASASEAARVFVTAYSGFNSSFDVYLRTSLRANGMNHSEGEWQLMDCDVQRNLSPRAGVFLEYEFYLNNLPKFDVYDLKIVLRGKNPVEVPIIKDYRAIMAV